MLDAVSFKNLKLTRIFSNRNGDTEFAVRIFQKIPPFAGDREPIAGFVEIEIDRLKGIRIFRNAVFQILKRERVAESEQELL